MTMAKRRNLKTRALGAEPGVPDVPALAAWIAERRGSAGDLTSYQLETLLVPQIEAGITLPCGGGRFYQDRLLESFSGIEGRTLTGETGIRPGLLSADAAGLVSLAKGAWCAFPAPHLLSITDGYYGDVDEASEALLALYRGAMRTMRDAGIGGHVLICDRADPIEISSLARQNVFIFHPKPGGEDLETILEYQRQVAIGPDGIDRLLSLSHEYEIGRVILLDPDEQSILKVLSHMDPEQVAAGGYCRESCDTYWKDLVVGAFYVP